MFHKLPAHIVHLAASALCLLSVSAWAQSAYPSKPIKLIVPFAAGGSTDLVARVVADGLRNELGQSVVVDNRAGAGGMMGTEAIATSASDGYTIGMATVSTLAVNPIFYEKSVTTNKLLLPLANLVSIPAVYMIHPSVHAKDFAGLVTELKRKPGGYSAGVPGVGSLGHLMQEAFNDQVGVQVQVVPYRGMGAALTDALAGTLQFYPDQLPSALPHIKSGKLLPVAVASPKRLSELPQLPTLKELGYPELNELGSSWFGLVVPAKLPPEIVARLQQAAHKAMQNSETRTRLQQIGASISTEGTDPVAFQALVDKTLKRHRDIVQKANIRID